MIIIFVFFTPNYTLWNKKINKNRVALKPKTSTVRIYIQVRRSSSLVPLDSCLTAAACLCSAY